MVTTAQYAGFGRRLVAVLLDGLVIMVLSFLLGMVLGAVGLGTGPKSVTYSMGVSTNSAGAGALGTLLSFALTCGYVVWYQSVAGQTIGKKVLGVKVVDASGKTPSVLTFFLREVIGKIISVIILGIGYLMVLWDGKKQGLHDKIASTYVIRV